MRTKELWTLVLGVTLTGLTLFADAGVYKCRDAGGKIAYQDQPCAGDTAVASQSADKGNGQQSDKSFLWKAQSGGATVYLLGSIHFGRPDMYPLAPTITAAFEQSKALVVEANILDADPMAMAQKMAGAGMYTDGGNLQEAVSSQTWRDLERVAAQLDIPMTFLAQQRPWMVAMTLEVLALKRAGYDENMGIDAHFLGQARARGKQIVELESVDYQLDLFNQLTPREQDEMLRDMLREFQRGPEYFATMISAWRKGDVQSMDGLIKEGFSPSPESARVKKLLFTDRNNAMTRKIQDLARQGGTYFVVVGAGHMVGGDGIVTQLRTKGFQMQQM